MPKILIAEDNKKIAEVLSQYLRKKGLEAEVARDGASALRSFSDGAYDLLLVNAKLPFLSGEAVCSKVRESATGKKIPIILMSGPVQDPTYPDRIKKELDLAGFLIKPFSSENLYSMISSSLAAKMSKPRKGPAPAGPIKGRMDKTPFEQLLLFIMKSRGTGILLVARDERKRKFFFLGGAPVELSVYDREDSFGNFLSRKGLITTVEMTEFEERVKKEGGDPRELFIKMGCLIPERFQEENRDFLVEKITECFTWREGLFSFEPRPSFLNACPSASAYLPHIFHQGFKKHVRPEAISSFLNRKGHMYVDKTPEFYEFQNHLIPEKAGDQVFDLIDGSKTCSEVINSIDIEDESAATLLYTIDFMKMLSFSEKQKRSEILPSFPVRERTRKPSKKEEAFEDIGEELSELADELQGLEEIRKDRIEVSENETLNRLEENLRLEWERIKDKNYYEIFGMTANSFSFENLKKSYFDLTRNYGPEKFFASSSDVMGLAEEFLSKVSNAYNTLSNVVSKENYDELLSSQEVSPAGGEEEKKFHVQIQFQSGKVFLEQGQYESAEKAFINCVNIEPEKPEYQAYLAVAIYNNPANRGNPSAAKRAKDLINKSLQLGKLSIAYALKGSILLDEGNLNLAEAEFNKALKLNPNNRTAIKKMESIREKREQEKKGLFQRMFT